MTAKLQEDAEARPERERARLRRWATRLAELGTSGYPPQTRRRLRNINVACYAIAVASALFALTFALEDVSRYRVAVAINVMMMVDALFVPAIHRLHEAAGALFMAFVLMGGLFVIVALLGRESGIEINLVAASVLAFLILELRRRAYIVAIIAAALVLHIVAWLWFDTGLLPGEPDHAFLTRLHVTTIVTISTIVAVAVYYAF